MIRRLHVDTPRGLENSGGTIAPEGGYFDVRNDKTAMGIAVGIAIGAGIGIVAGNIAMGIGVGLALGIALGLAWKS